MKSFTEKKINPSELQNPEKLAAVYRKFVEEFARDSLEADEQKNSQVENFGENVDEPVGDVADGESDNDEQFLELSFEQDLSTEEKLDRLRAKYPLEFTTDSLNIAETERLGITSAGVTAVRGVASVWNLFSSTVASYTPEWVRSIVSYPISAVSYIIPTAVANGFSKMTKSLQLPVSNEEHKKTAFISKAETKIEELAKGLNYEGNTDISAKDFSKMSSKEINELADKIALIGHMVNIQKCLAEYRHRQMKGIVKVTQVSIFSSIVEWLSKTSFRYYIHDRLLLTLEAKELEASISELVKTVDQSEGYDKLQVTEALATALSTTQNKVSVIKEKNVYGRFFGGVKQEIQAATEELEQVTEVGKKLNLTGSDTDSESPSTSTESSNSTPRNG